ncbi:radical SAM protein [Yinghuangia sp. YIM S10712]|uniref:radical SAM protein n=1 Tax=Yinghuangia sp. YIM S10712 TaxID=3436930 RepID=UPI003F53C236
MHTLIASPFLGEYVVLRPGHEQGLRIPARAYRQLEQASVQGAVAPAWLKAGASDAWGIELGDGPVGSVVNVRHESAAGYARASWEINLGCNYNCEHCYLPERPFRGLPFADKELLLRRIAESGVLWLQITGGEPLVDRDFPDAYVLAYELGMMIQISSNGSRLASPRILDLLTSLRPYRLTLSVYGASAETYDGLTRTRGAYKAFRKGLAAAHEAGLPLRLNTIVTRHNQHEAEAMRALAEQYGAAGLEYVNITPTYNGDADVLAAQAEQKLRPRKPFTGCNAGITHFHADPMGLVSICKIGRDPQFDLLHDGPGALTKLSAVADSLMLRTGGCSGCALSATCGTCRPMAKVYQEARAPLSYYCQHAKEEVNV